MSTLVCPECGNDDTWISVVTSETGTTATCGRCRHPLTTSATEVRVVEVYGGMRQTRTRTR